MKYMKRYVVKHFGRKQTKNSGSVNKTHTNYHFPGVISKLKAYFYLALKYQ